MDENGPMCGTEDREETVLASRSVQATVRRRDVDKHGGNPVGPGVPVPLSCRSACSTRGTQAYAAVAAAREPKRVERLLVAGRPLAAGASKATFVGDDGAKCVCVGGRNERWIERRPPSPISVWREG